MKYFFNDIKTTTEAYRHRNIIARSVHNIGYLQKPDHRWTESSEESLSLLMDIHFLGSSKNHTGKYTPDGGVVIVSIAVDIVSENTVHRALSTFKLFKLPGPDGMVPKQNKILVSNYS